jgi:outer membrane receptor protein involved in Fe transport
VVGLLGGRIDLMSIGNLTFGASTHHALISSDSPGPVASSTGAPEGDVRVTSSPFFRFDETQEQRHDLVLDGRWQAPVSIRQVGNRYVDVTLFGRLRSADVTRTLQLSPEFGDTRRRDIDAGRAGAEIRATHEPVFLDSRVIVGGSASVERLESAYAPVAFGTADEYIAAAPDLDAPADIQGQGTRRSLAAYVHAETSPIPALRLVAGLRADGLRDRYDPTLPDSAEVDATHTAWSPRAGANLQWMRTSLHAGHLYAQVGRHFKAPTLDQLFDQRTIPVPFPPFSVSLSNIGLSPQHGVATEVGLFHRAEVLPGRLALEGELAVYRIDMENEIDFSIEQFAYVNVGRSRHEGVEAGLGAVILGPSLRVDATYAHQAATLRQGDYEGNFLKAIPRDVWSVVATLERGPARASIAVHGADRIWLDDANTIPLEGWSTVDARLAWTLPGPAGDVTVTADAYNLFDSEYSTTGFPDASGSSVVYYWPAAGRQFVLGVSAAF